MTLVGDGTSPARAFIILDGSVSNGGAGILSASSLSVHGGKDGWFEKVSDVRGTPVLNALSLSVYHSSAGQTVNR